MVTQGRHRIDNALEFAGVSRQPAAISLQSTHVVPFRLSIRNENLLPILIRSKYVLWL